MLNETSPATNDHGNPELHGSHERILTEKLSASRLFKDYERAFFEATGLSVEIQPVGGLDGKHAQMNKANRFCALVARTKGGCANCLEMRRDLHQAANHGTKSLFCFAGLCDSAIPVRVGHDLIAFLHTGQVLLHQPNQEEFSRTTRQLLAWGAEVDFKALEEAYFQTRVLGRSQYDAMLRLLSTFARHLEIIGSHIECEISRDDPAIVGRAKRYMNARHQEQISLDEAARAVNVSTRQFCKVFRQATGLTFTEYLARIRVEKAKSLLLNPKLRISEVAFETGFNSISQFNRSFKRIVGDAPSRFRSRQRRA